MCNCRGRHSNECMISRPIYFRRFKKLEDVVLPLTSGEDPPPEKIAECNWVDIPDYLWSGRHFKLFVRR